MMERAWCRAWWLMRLQCFAHGLFQHMVHEPAPVWRRGGMLGMVHVVRRQFLRLPRLFPGGIPPTVRPLSSHASVSPPLTPASGAIPALTQQPPQTPHFKGSHRRSSIPLHAPKLRHIRQRPVPKLHVRRADDARVELHRVAHARVRIGRGVIPHDEVVAVAVLHLVADQGLREGVDAVVLDAADDAALAEDDLPAGYGDSGFLLASCPLLPSLSMCPLLESLVSILSLRRVGRGRGLRSREHTPSPRQGCQVVPKPPSATTISKNMRVAGSAGETYYPYQFVEHFGCVGREVGGWTCRFRRWFGGALGNFGDAATPMRFAHGPAVLSTPTPRLDVYLISLSYRRHVFVHESIAAFGIVLSLKTFSFFSSCFYSIYTLWYIRNFEVWRLGDGDWSCS